MRVVKINVEPREASAARFAGAMRGKKQGHFITFESAALLFDTLTPGRWEILTLLMGRGSLMALDVHEMVGRPMADVCMDLETLVQRGVVDLNDNGSVSFPYDQVELAFTWTGPVRRCGE